MPDQEYKVDLWLGNHISRYIWFIKLEFSLIIKLGVLTCPVIILLKFNNSANWWQIWIVVFNKCAFSMQI